MNKLLYTFTMLLTISSLTFCMDRIRKAETALKEAKNDLMAATMKVHRDAPEIEVTPENAREHCDARMTMIRKDPKVQNALENLSKATAELAAAEAAYRKETHTEAPNKNPGSMCTVS